MHNAFLEMDKNFAEAVNCGLVGCEGSVEMEGETDEELEDTGGGDN